MRVGARLGKVDPRMALLSRVLLEHPLEAVFLLVGMLVAGAAWAGWVVGQSDRDVRRADRSAREAGWRLRARLRPSSGRRKE